MPATWPTPSTTSSWPQARSHGLTGAGVTVAVFDSGIDYTHADLAGPGTAAAYDTCYSRHATPSRPTSASAPTCSGRARRR